MAVTASAVIRSGRRLDFSQEVVGEMSPAKSVSHPDSPWSFESYSVAAENFAISLVDTPPSGARLQNQPLRRPSSSYRASRQQPIREMPVAASARRRSEIVPIGNTQVRRLMPNVASQENNRPGDFQARCRRVDVSGGPTAQGGPLCEPLGE